MRVVPATITESWNEGRFEGSRRNIARVTVQYTRTGLQNQARNLFAYTAFGSFSPQREIANVRKVEWSRATQSDAAECTIEIWNTEPLPVGGTITRDLDQPGYLCVDTETEVLSERGWLSGTQVQRGDVILTVNPDTGLAEWQPVNLVFRDLYDGDMVSMESKSMSALVTPDHRWATTYGKRAKRTDSLVMKRTYDLSDHDLIPTIRDLAEDVPQRHDDTFVELVGWVTTEGSYQRSDGQRIAVYQSHKANPDKVDQIRTVLKRCYAEFSEKQRSDGMTVFRFSGQLARQVRAVMPEKLLTMEFVLELTIQQRQLLMDVLIAGDGGPVGGDTLQFRTSVESQAGVVQALAGLCGHATRVTHREWPVTLKGKEYEGSQYLVNIKKRRNVRVADTHPTKQRYQGMIWCPQTENGTFFARRGGQTYFTGNTYNRGTTSFSVRWGHTQNEWSGGERFTQGPGYLVPDNTIRTYEGYGFDDSVFPEDDPNLVQTGCWLIDDVEYTHDGLIIVRCRDYARLLLDHIVFPPVNPFRAGFTTPEMPYGAYAYPVRFEARPFVEETSGPLPTAQELVLTGASASSSHVDHPPADALRGDTEGWDSGVSTYWLSGSGVVTDYQWLEASLNNLSVSQVRFRPVKDSYRAYVSVMSGGTWQGTETVNGIPYLQVIDVKSEDWHFFTFSAAYANVSAVRITFTQLQPFTEGGNRVGVRIIEAWGSGTTAGDVEGAVVPMTGTANYEDYSDLVKLFCAWGGFYWPTNAGIAKTMDAWAEEATERVFYNWATEDPALTIQKGRVWGDFEQTGTYGVSELTPAIFDKKTLMDGVNYIREITGFIFYVDELGSVVWRAPNIYAAGNLILTGADRKMVKTTQIIEIDEEHTLIGLRAKLSGRNLRERTFVSSTDGKYAGMAQGWNPNPGAAFRRVGGWSDTHFESTRECQVMAEMIALRQLWSYRSDNITIPANPAIQIDDQVRIFEAVTGEGFLHYVTAISSTNDMENGGWNYDMEAHWLGEYPFQRWAFDPAMLSAEAQAYLQGIYGARV